LLDGLVLVHFEKMALETGPLVFDCFAIHIADGLLQELPDPVQVTPMNAANPQVGLLVPLGFTSRRAFGFQRTLVKVLRS